MLTLTSLAELWGSLQGDFPTYAEQGYERGDMMPSIEIATKISEALGVSLDFLVGKSSLLVKDKNMLERLEDIAKLPATKQTELFNVMDAYLRDYRTSKAYAK